MRCVIGAKRKKDDCNFIFAQKCKLVQKGENSLFMFQGGIFDI